MKHLLPELPYQLEALAPKMSKENTGIIITENICKRT